MRELKLLGICGSLRQEEYRPPVHINDAAQWLRRLDA